MSEAKPISWKQRVINYRIQMNLHPGIGISGLTARQVRRIKKKYNKGGWR